MLRQTGEQLQVKATELTDLQNLQAEDLNSTSSLPRFEPPRVAAQGF